MAGWGGEDYNDLAEVLAASNHYNATTGTLTANASVDGKVLPGDVLVVDYDRHDKIFVVQSVSGTSIVIQSPDGTKPSAVARGTGKISLARPPTWAKDDAADIYAIEEQDGHTVSAHSGWVVKRPQGTGRRKGRTIYEVLVASGEIVAGDSEFDAAVLRSKGKDTLNVGNAASANVVVHVSDYFDGWEGATIAAAEVTDANDYFSVSVDQTDGTVEIDPLAAGNGQSSDMTITLTRTVANKKLGTLYTSHIRANHAFNFFALHEHVTVGGGTTLHLVNGDGDIQAVTTVGQTNNSQNFSITEVTPTVDFYEGDNVYLETGTKTTTKTITVVQAS